MIAIIDYGLGNLASVKNTLNRLKIPVIITSNIVGIQNSDAIILPGVGSAKQGMENLIKRKLDKVLIAEIKKGKPFLGICLGMQLLFSESEEGNVDCLNIIKGKVKQFNNKNIKVPQIGWNTVKQKTENKLFKNIQKNSSFYFVNSYYCQPKDKSIIVGETEYGVNFCSILVKGNIVATQFHPEKSGRIGQRFIKNWIKLI